jgi:cell division protein FtsW
MTVRFPYDKPLLFATLSLIGLGLIMIYSASVVVAETRFGDPYFFLKRQLIWATLGIAVMVTLMFTDYSRLRRWFPLLLLSAFILLVLVFVPGIGSKVGKVRRWLYIFGVSFQPSELVKLALIIYTAEVLDRRREHIKEFLRGFLPRMVVIGIFVVLITLQPDVGTGLLLILGLSSLLFVGGVRLGHILATGGVLIVPAFIYLITNSAYRMRRIWAFWDPWSDPGDRGFQIIQSFFAFGRGGFWGVGLGEGKQKLLFLPQPHTDFIYSVIGEELGFGGAALVVILFALIAWRGIAIAKGAPDAFGAYLAAGFTIMLTLQAFINMGMTLSLLPTKGLPLPLVSFGGSSMVCTMAGMGILLNISQYSTHDVKG